MTRTAIFARCVTILLLATGACTKTPERTPTEVVRDKACACTSKECAEAVVPLYNETSHKEGDKPGGWTKGDHDAMNKATYCLSRFI